MFNFFLWALPVFFFFGTFILTAFSTAMRRIYRKNSKKDVVELDKYFFYRPFHLKLIPTHEYEGIFFATLAALSLCRFLFSFSLAALFFVYYDFIMTWPLGGAFVLLLFLLMIFIVSDYLPRFLGFLNPKITFKIFAPFASLYLILALPLTYLFVSISNLFFHSATLDMLHEPLAEAKQEIFDILQESELEDKLEPDDKRLIESVVNFRDLIVREVMMPRVELFTLPAEISVKDAAQKIEEEGYSRIPIYKGTIDQLIGIVMYKDVLAKYMEAAQTNDPSILNNSIESIVKPVIYTPETKRISHLLQEFRSKQMHLAVVVDEYGGTEGIVTIEDILEELVGDIEDEYDDEEDLYITLADGSLIVDASISLLDLEQQLDITLPEEGDYDSLGGYIFHIAGEIPTRGFTIKQDDFDIEVLRANERMIEKVKIRRKN